VSSQHLLIAGTGRAGTSVLVQLLGACGLETGIDDLRFNNSARAGLEQRLVAEGSPYVVKSPYLSEDLAAFIESGFDPSRIDAILIPLRDLDDAVASRIKVFIKSGYRAPGGLWRAKRPGSQRAILAESVHQLLLTAAEYRIRIVLFTFPRFVNDGTYAWECLKSVLPDVDEATFLQKHAELLRPELVSTLPHYGPFRMAIFDCWWAIRKLRAVVRGNNGRRRLPPGVRRGRPGAIEQRAGGGEHLARQHSASTERP
jgi:hypothetical protein